MSLWPGVVELGGDSWEAVCYILFLLLLLLSLSVKSNSATPWTAARQASLSFTISPSLLKLMSIESVMPSYHLILCHPLLLLPSVFLSIRALPQRKNNFANYTRMWCFHITSACNHLEDFWLTKTDFTIHQVLCIHEKKNGREITWPKCPPKTYLYLLSNSLNPF